MVPVEVTVSTWKRNSVQPSEARGRALMLPGTGYTCDRPLLYWAAQALVESNWRVDRMSLRNTADDLAQVTPVINASIDAWVDEAKQQSASGNPRLLLIAKSLTTLTYPHVAVTHQLPFVLLTPVLHHADFDPSVSIIPTGNHDGHILPETDSTAEAAEAAGAIALPYPGPAPLICAGTADPFYDRQRALRITPHVHEYPDANHSIEVPGHWRRSLDYLKEVTASVQQYAGAIA